MKKFSHADQKWDMIRSQLDLTTGLQCSDPST